MRVHLFLLAACLSTSVALAQDTAVRVELTPGVDARSPFIAGGPMLLELTVAVEQGKLKVPGKVSAVLETEGGDVLAPGLTARKARAQTITPKKSGNIVLGLGPQLSAKIEEGRHRLRVKVTAGETVLESPIFDLWVVKPETRVVPELLVNTYSAQVKYFEWTRDKKSALASMEHAHEVDPHTYATLMQLGDVYSSQGYHHDAKVIYEEAAHASLGDPKLAKAAMDKMLRAKKKLGASKPRRTEPGAHEH